MYFSVIATKQGQINAESKNSLKITLENLRFLKQKCTEYALFAWKNIENGTEDKSVKIRTSKHEAR